MMMIECQVMQITDEWWEFSRLAASMGIDISMVLLWCNSIYRMKCDTLDGNEQNRRMTLFFSMIRNKNKRYYEINSRLIRFTRFFCTSSFFFNARCPIVDWHDKQTHLLWFVLVRGFSSSSTASTRFNRRQFAKCHRSFVFYLSTTGYNIDLQRW